MPHGAFHAHLAEAIHLNRQRRPFYAGRTGGRSRALSTRLIVLERLLLPLARAVDRFARRFNREGIPIVLDDFAPMQAVPSAAAPPRYAGRISRAQAARVGRLLQRHRCAFLRAARRGELEAACRAAAALLGRIEAREAAWGVHFALSAHLVESLGYGALHGLAYARRSGGRTLGLSRLLLAGHALVLPHTLGLDLQAQALHRLGVGILVNDVPQIPFREEAAAHRAATGAARPVARSTH